MSHLKWKILRSTLWTNFGALTTTMFMKKPPSAFLGLHHSICAERYLVQGAAYFRSQSGISAS